ncbi:MAG TPA: 2-phosphosulfolactate phosphatase [Dokdonella sp.]|jgi:2-phosphosulfolactate phosphatase|nr:2-phosphosulfolactate phosphatase [Dokdonella sp.]
MPKLHVLLKREEIDPARLRGKVIIVLDILFATTTIVHAFAQGAARIHPVRTRDEGLALARGCIACLLAGEYRARPIDGFAPATPMALAASGLDGVELIYCTTNGTQALVAVSGAEHVYVGALLNGKALAAHVAANHPLASVLIVCSGSLDRFNLEDFHGAGHLVAHLSALADYALSDAAIAALHAYRGTDTLTALQASRVGRMMSGYGLDAEVAFASGHDTLDVVPVMVGAELVRAAA